MYRGLLLLFSFIFSTAFVSAQSVLTPALSDTLQLSQIQEHNQLIYIKGSETLMTAIIEDYYESGQIKLRRSVVEGKAVGLWMEWYESGIPRFLAEWDNGKGHGLWVYFHENGQLRARETVVQDIWHGISEFWYANGLKRSEGYHRQGQKHGAWNYWNEDGVYLKTEKYINGTLISSINSYSK